NFSHISSLIWKRLNASMAHCGDPHHRQSVPQITWSEPYVLMFLPIPCMHMIGSAIISGAKKLPISQCTLVICGLRSLMSMRILCHRKSPVVGSYSMFFL